MKTLELHDLKDIDRLVWPDDHAEIDLHAPARAIFTDFHESEPLVVNADMTAVEADRLLRQSHVGLWLVVDSHGRFAGVVGREHLAERNRVRYADGRPVSDLTVRDLMIPRHRIRAIDLEDLEGASVRDLVETLRFHGDHHCLVVGRAEHRICGLIAASDISRRLNVRVDVDGPPSFAQIHAAVRG